MRNIRIYAVFTIFLGFFLFNSCATEQVAENVVTYTNQGLLNIAELERKALENYASVIGENYTNDERLYEELKNNVVPLYSRFVNGLRNINPDEEEIKRVHRIYLYGADLLLDGFKTMMLGIETNNKMVIEQANEKIIKGSEEVNRWKLALYELYKKYGVGEVKEKEK
jgi:hypothetical protein